MLISTTIFFSIFTYTQLCINEYRTKDSITPYFFMIILLSFWTYFNFLFFNFGVSFDFLNFVFVFLYCFSILFYTTYLLRKIYVLKLIKYEFLKKIPILIIFLFFAIFLLFYKKIDFPFSTDQLYYYEMMHNLHLENTNKIINYTYSAYYLVGLDQLGISMNFENRFLLFPYFTTFIYFYAIFTALFFILNTFIKKYLLKISFLAILFFLFFVLWIYLNPHIFYVLMDGDGTDEFLPSILLIPTLINIKNSKFAKHEICLISFSVLFLNESIIAVNSIYSFCLLLIIYFYRRKNNFNFQYFLINFSLFIFNLFFTIYYLLIMINFNPYVITFFYYLVPTYVICCSFFVIFYFVLRLKFKTKFNNLFIALNYYWFKNFFIYHKTSNNWFVLNNFKNKIKNFTVIIIISFLIFLSSFSLYKTHLYDFDSFFVYYYFFIALFFSIVCCYIYFKNKNNIYFNFYMLLLFVINFISIWFIFKIEPNISLTIARIPKMGLFANGSEFLIKDIVIFLFFYFVAFNNSIKKHYYIFLTTKKNINTTWKFLYLILICSLICSSSISIIQYEETNKKKIGIDNIKNTIYYGLSLNTIYELSKFNFDHNWTFSPLYLNIFNNTLKNNINYICYGTYFQTKTFIEKLNMWTKIKFKNLNGNTLWSYDNVNIFKKEILPYYNYIVIRDNDSFFYNAIHYDKDFKEIKNLNNQLLIFENINLNKELQKKFMDINKDIN